jgi:hypothetical protein
MLLIQLLAITIIHGCAPIEKLTNDFKETFASEQRSLKELEERGWRVANAPFSPPISHALDWLTGNERLARKLDLKLRCVFNPIRVVADGNVIAEGDVAYLGRIRHLREAVFNNCVFERVNWSDLHQAIRNARVLSIMGSKGFDDVAIAEILNDCRSLETLRLSDTSVTDRGLKVLTKCPKLADVEISNCDVSDAGVASLVVLKHLRQLCLANTNITDRCSKDLRRMPGLMELDLSFNRNISDQCIDDICALPRLSVLLLSDNPRIGDAELTILLRIVTLKHIKVTNTNVSPSGVKKAEELRADLEILSD